MKDLQEFIKKDGARRRVSGGDGRKGKKAWQKVYPDEIEYKGDSK